MSLSIRSLLSTFSLSLELSCAVTEYLSRDGVVTIGSPTNDRAEDDDEDDAELELLAASVDTAAAVANARGRELSDNERGSCVLKYDGEVRPWSTLDASGACPCAL